MGGGSLLDRNPVPEEGRRPWVEVPGADGRREVVELAAAGLRVGREAGWTDLELPVDDRRWVSRRHFRIEREGAGWAVVDEGSRNGTFLRRGDALVRVDGTTRLESGDVVAILARMEGAAAVYWELVFRDPEVTEPAPQPGRSDPDTPRLEYDWVQGRAFVVRGRERDEVVGMRPQEHRLLRHLAGRNRDAGADVLCPYDDLVTAVWGDEVHAPHTREDLARLVYDLRRRIERDPSQPEVLTTVRGFGYRLSTATPT
jgi:hypothetical protein